MDDIARDKSGSDRGSDRGGGELALLRDMFRQSPTFMAVMRGPDLVYEYVNDRHRQLVGHREVVGLPLRKALPELEGTGVIETVERVFATGQPFGENDLPVRLQREPDGPLVERYIDVVYQPLVGPDGKVTAVLGHGVDVTDRHRDEDAKRQTEERLHWALRGARGGAWDWDLNTGEAWWSKEMYALWGVEPGTVMVGENSMALIVEGDRPRLSAALDEAIRDRGEFQCEFRIRHATLGERWMASFGRPQFNSTGRAVRLLGISVDVTERKRSEDTLRDSERRFRTLVEQASDAFFLHDDAGRFIDVNRHACESLGYTRDELLAMTVGDVEADFDLAVAQETWGRIVAGEAHTVDATQRRKDGTLFPAEARLSACELGGRRLILALVRDVTDRKRAEAEMRRARDDAEAASKAKDRLLAVVSHELRTPLNPVLAVTSYLLQRADLPDDLRDDIETIRRNVEHEARVVDDLLNVTRLSRGKVELHQEVVDLHALVRTAVEQVRPAALEGRIELSTDLRAADPLVWADPVRMAQVLLNLLENAVKFTPRGGRVAVRTCAAEDAGRIRLEVSDTGIGIEPDVLGRLFTPFEQGEMTVTRRFGGLGLGLVIVKGIMELHGGTVRAESPGAGRGTTFALELATTPAVPDAPPPSPSRPATPAGTPSAPADRSPLPAHRVLLVEDHPDTLRIMSRLLRSLGYRVVTAINVAEAVDRMNSDPFDLLVSDIGLPDGSGLDVMRELRRRGNQPGIAVSGFGHDDDIRRSREAGFVAHLVKPLDFADLESTLKTLVVK